MNPIDLIEQQTTGLTCHRIDCADLPVRVRLSVFKADSGATEIHLSAVPTSPADFGMQLCWLTEAYHKALATISVDARSAVFRRLFCSDPVNQTDALTASTLGQIDQSDEACAVSIVGQLPVPPAKVALLAYHIHDPAEPLDKSHSGSTLELRRAELTHHWTTGMSATDTADPGQQSRCILNDYRRYLNTNRMTLADHTLRTWLFVRDIDVNYDGLVLARNEVFAEHGLNADTHYIASTGIGGVSADHHALVTMDAWAVAGLHPNQVRYLKAGDHLSPTNMYGVTFERGTVVAYRDRQHVIVSGTASIDPLGRIIHPGNVHRQLDRTMTNIEALVHEAGANTSDIASWIVYLRDASDFAAISDRLRERFGDTPMVLVQAPVCRPGWLIEIECHAISPTFIPSMPSY